MEGMRSDGGERMGMTGGDPISGDMPNEAFPDCPAPLCKQQLTTKIVLTFPNRYFIDGRTGGERETCGEKSSGQSENKRGEKVEPKKQFKK